MHPNSLRLLIYRHVDKKHWELVKWDSVPDKLQIAPYVWSLWRKCNLLTNEITIHKARLNLHGGKQVDGMNYYEAHVADYVGVNIHKLKDH